MSLSWESSGKGCSVTIHYVFTDHYLHVFLKTNNLPWITGLLHSCRKAHWNWSKAVYNVLSCPTLPPGFFWVLRSNSRSHRQIFIGWRESIHTDSPLMTFPMEITQFGETQLCPTVLKYFSRKYILPSKRLNFLASKSVICLEKWWFRSIMII